MKKTRFETCFNIPKRHRPWWWQHAQLQRAVGPAHSPSPTPTVGCSGDPEPPRASCFLALLYSSGHPESEIPTDPAKTTRLWGRSLHRKDTWEDVRSGPDKLQEKRSWGADVKCGSIPNLERFDGWNMSCGKGLDMFGLVPRLKICIGSGRVDSGSWKMLVSVSQQQDFGALPSLRASASRQKKQPTTRVRPLKNWCQLTELLNRC